MASMNAAWGSGLRDILKQRYTDLTLEGFLNEMRPNEQTEKLSKYHIVSTQNAAGFLAKEGIRGRRNLDGPCPQHKSE
ncbi:hypothetical protein ACO22_04483 [Paracoccidioides brasiliensis]|uniref:Uncharacterized protein n=1 Tax=Paracoccidioides brasiliensis TaxID=121759 RepID=A0A1D2JD09_PARBR|nr:hypothetical protein ACO22_04483 [Paracoccidioides brasiliensis]